MDEAGTIDEIADLYRGSAAKKDEITRAASLNRVLAKIVDFVLVFGLVKMMPGLGFFAGLVYLAASDGLFQGRSIGKKLLGFRVFICRENSEEVFPCGYRESVLRNAPFAAAYLISGLFWNIPVLGSIFSFIVIAAVLVFESLVMLGSENGKRFGDEVAGTQVVVDKQGGINVS